MHFYPDSYNQSSADTLYNPKINDFTLMYLGEDCQLGLVSKVAFKENTILAKIRGQYSHEIKQHTLQVANNVHIHDPYFSGYILHSCSPNTQLDAESRLLTAIKPINPYDILTMDYAHTEDKLYKQFNCQCGSAHCRGWITGRAESKNTFQEPEPLELEIELNTER